MKTVLNYCKNLPEKSFSPSDLLIEEGGIDTRLYILIEGEVEIFKGDVFIAVQDEPGAIFGEMSLLLNLPSTATVKATLPTRTYEVSDGNIFLKNNPDLAYLLATLLAKRLHNVNSYLVDVKKQYEDRLDHLCLMDEVLESLLIQQLDKVQPGSARYTEPD